MLFSYATLTSHEHSQDKQLFITSDISPDPLLSIPLPSSCSDLLATTHLFSVTIRFASPGISHK